jgi:hypothetical protein
MPNHVTSELIFRGLSEEQAADVLAGIVNAEGKVDFNILVPTPLNLWLGNEGSDHERAFGKRLGMTWSRENWGTKWNAYKSREPVFADGVLTVTFDTAWSPPYPWIAAVFNRFKISFEHNWLDEGADWSVSGAFDYPELEKGFGHPWRETRASRETHERLHTLKWGVAQFDDEDA